MDYLVTFEDGSSRYLSHHGIKGMKWGVWNAETRARYGRTTKGQKFKTDETHPFRSVYSYSDYAVTRGQNAKLTEVLKDSSINTLFKYMTTYKDYGDSFRKELESLSMEPEPIDKAFSKVNNLYGAPGYDDNCMGCSIATILRAKGFDVEADSSLADYTDESGGAIESLNMSKTPFVKAIFGRELKPLSQTSSESKNGWLLADVYKNEPMDSNGNPVDPNHAVRAYYAAVLGDSEPEGSYGFIRGGYNGGSGHIMTYRIENKKPVIYDGQTSESSSFEEATKDFNLDSISSVRLDDADINYDELGKWGGVRPHESHWDR